MLSTSDLLRKSALTADEQLQIEDAITALAQNRNCTRARAAQLLHQQAYR